MVFREIARLLCDSRLPPLLVVEDELAAEVPLEGDEKLKELECTDAADVATKPAAILLLLSGFWLCRPRWWPP